MGGVSNKAIKSYKLLWNIYKVRIIKGLNEVLMMLVIIGTFYMLGLCYGNDCAYIEEYPSIYVYEPEPINEPPQDYLMANNIFNWLIGIGTLSAGLSAWLWDNKRKQKPQQAINKMLENMMKQE